VKRFAVVLFSVLCFGIIFGAPPAPGMSGAGMPKDGVHKLPDVSRMIKAGAPAKEVARALGTTTGTISVVAIFVNFSDVKFSEAGGTGGTISNYVTPIVNGSKYQERQADI